MPVLLGISLLAGAAGGGCAKAEEGGIVVTVRAREATPVQMISVFVDGKQTACTRSPCTISGQASGRHVLKVLAEGFATPAQQSIEVRPRANLPVTFTVDPHQGLRVSGTQPGVKLYLDGKELGDLPQEIHDLALGSHNVRCAGDEAYQPLEQQIQVAPGKMTELAITLKVLKGQLSVLPGAIPATQVTLLNGVEHYVLPQLPVENFELSTEHPWTLRATAPGYADYEQPFGFDDGERKKTYSVRFPSLQGASEPLHELDSMDIQTTVARYMGSVKRACWQPALDTRNPDAPTTARVALTLTVLPNGSVQSAAIKDESKGYRGLAQCVSRRVQGWQFPPSNDSTTVNIPFVFARE